MALYSSKSLVGGSVTTIIVSLTRVRVIIE